MNRSNILNDCRQEPQRRDGHDDSVPLVESRPAARGSHRGRLVHRARQRFEGRLDNMMRIAAAEQVQMQVHADLVAQRLHEVVHQLGLEGADPLLR